MKLELIKETEHGKSPWYEVRKDGQFVRGSYTLETAEEIYNLLLEGKYQKKTVEILKSEEFDVSL
jgi:hypothetical protein